jgi:hypothetical protein
METKRPANTQSAGSGTQGPSPHGGDPSPQSPYLSPPLDDFWGQQVAEKAKAKVLGYFATATALIAAVSFLYGKETIDHAVQAEVKSAVASKTSLIDRQIEDLMRPERDKIARLEEQVADLNKLLDTYRKSTETQYNSFSELIIGSEASVSALLASQSKNLKPASPVVQTTFDLSPSIGEIIDSSASNAGESAAALYAIKSSMPRGSISPLLSVAGAFYGAGGGEAGITSAQLFSYLKNVGAYRRSDWPNEVRTKPASVNPIVQITGFSSAKGTTLASVVSLLNTGKVVVAEMILDVGLSQYKSGVYNAAKGQTIGVHLMAVVGYDKSADSLKLANSWGASWGEGGFVRLSTKAFSERVGDIYWISGVKQL